MGKRTAPLNTPSRTVSLPGRGGGIIRRRSEGGFEDVGLGASEYLSQAEARCPSLFRTKTIADLLHRTQPLPLTS